MGGAGALPARSRARLHTDHHRSRGDEVWGNQGSVTRWTPGTGELGAYLAGILTGPPRQVNPRDMTTAPGCQPPTALCGGAEATEAARWQAVMGKRGPAL